LTPDLLLEIHKLITEGTLTKREHEGAFRETNDVVVGDPFDSEKIYHIPPDHKKIPTLIQTLCDFANEENGRFIHPVIKGIIIHFLISYIHPFYDGNGRTARAVFYWYILKRGYWLFEFMTISRVLLRSKTGYGLAFQYTETDENDLTYFIKYNLKAIEEAFNDMKEYIKQKQKEQTKTLELIKKTKGINFRQADIIKTLMRSTTKTINVSEVKNTYGVAYETARSDLLNLMEKGHIYRTKVGRKLVFKLLSLK